MARLGALWGRGYLRRGCDRKFGERDALTPSGGPPRSTRRPTGSTSRDCGRSPIRNTLRSDASQPTAAFGGTSAGSTCPTSWPRCPWDSSPSPRAPGMCSLARSTWAGSMSETIAFTTAEDESNANATCYPSGDNRCYPSAETFSRLISKETLGTTHPEHHRGRALRRRRCAHRAGMAKLRTASYSLLR
jgi:hypothetical protein